MGREQHSASARRASWETCGGARLLGFCTSVDFDQVILDNQSETGCDCFASCPGPNAAVPSRNLCFGTGYHLASCQCSFTVFCTGMLWGHVLGSGVHTNLRSYDRSSRRVHRLQWPSKLRLWRTTVPTFYPFTSGSRHRACANFPQRCGCTSRTENGRLTQ